MIKNNKSFSTRFNSKIDETLINECEFTTCIFEPILITSGIIFNLIFLYIINTNKNTRNKQRKPMYYLLLMMTLCDLWNLSYSLITFINISMDITDMNSHFNICQLSSYFNKFFEFLNLCIIISVDFILISVIKIKISTSFVYNQNLVETNCESMKENIRKRKNRVSVEKYIQNSQIKRIIYKEDFLMIFFPFFSLYLLSFHLWTHGDSTDEAKNLFTFKMCKTYDFAKKFINIYSNILKIMRLFVIFFSFFISIVYNIKFRSDLFSLIFRNLKSNQNVLILKNNSSYLRFMNFFCLKENNIKTNENSVNQKENYFYFLQFWAIFLFFYSLILISTCFKDVYALISDEFKLNSIINNELSLLDDSDLEISSNEIFFNFTEKLALSFKLIIYVLFFFHFKIYVQYKKNLLIV
jgi:hypothetical protein